MRRPPFYRKTTTSSPPWAKSRLSCSESIGLSATSFLTVFALDRRSAISTPPNSSATRIEKLVATSLPRLSPLNSTNSREKQCFPKVFPNYFPATPIFVNCIASCNPLATMPDQMRVLKGLERDDLFTVVFEQVFTDTCRFADVVLPATTFLEQYDIAKAYGSISMGLVRPVIEAQGEARSNPVVFSELAERLGIGTAEDDTDTLMRIASRMTNGIGAELLEKGYATPPYDGAPIQFVDVFPLTPDRKVNLYPEHVAQDAPAGLYGYQLDPATEQYPLALISPATEKTISSTLGELRERAAMLHINPADATVRGIAQSDAVRVFNALGEFQCPANLTADVRPGTVAFSKGVWRKNTYNGFSSNAVVPDSLTDLGAGACFNDARVQVALLGRH